MSTPKRIVSTLRLIRPASISPSQRCCRCFANAAKVEQWPQRTPLGKYYESILNNSSPYLSIEKPEEPPKSADPEALPPERKQKKPDQLQANASKALSDPTIPLNTLPPEPTPPPTSVQEKARIIFGSRLLGPAEQVDRLATKNARSTFVAGILIPPRPEEPDNCCMSGCVNCVWDSYREDLEEWSAKKSEAEARLKTGGSAMDADGGGLEASWDASVGSNKIAKDMWNEEVFQNVPVGIREFMKQEKRLKERHEREGTSRG